MKKTALILALLATGLGLNAQESKLSYSVTVDFPYASKYVFRGIEYAKDSIQPSIEVASGNFYAGVWTNQPVTNNSDNEFDFYAGYGIPLNDKWKLDVGATLYYYPEADTSSFDEQTFEGFIGLTGTVSGFTPGIYAYYDFDLKAFTVQGSVGYSISLESAGTSLDFTVTLGNVSPDVGDDYIYYGIGVNLPYKLTEKATFAVGAQYASNDLDGADDNHLWFTAGLTVGF
ncbi:MAG: hypothetical protein JNJ82_00465 [Opitutaceae bacterium]|nr:hypothetical protein [Opitutaceae bacterium]